MSAPLMEVNAAGFPMPLWPQVGETAGGTSPLCVKCVAGKARFFTPWDERRQVVRGHACGDSARIFFDERRPEAHVLHSHPHLPISHGLKAP